jgi:hypothetical protein
MKSKNTMFLILISFLSFYAFGQDNKNSISINGVVYYFRPSTTPSSEMPIQSDEFYSSGSWYGENAARVWASLSDWAIERCLETTRAITGGKNERVYISAIYIYRKGDKNYDTLREGIYPNKAYVYDYQIRIDYWVVRNDAQLADGRREKRWFGF